MASFFSPLNSDPFLKKRDQDHFSVDSVQTLLVWPPQGTLKICYILNTSVGQRNHFWPSAVSVQVNDETSVYLYSKETNYNWIKQRQWDDAVELTLEYISQYTILLVVSTYNTWDCFCSTAVGIIKGGETKQGNDALYIFHYSGWNY